MKRTMIILLVKNNKATPYGSFKSLCKEMGWSYHTQCRKAFPFEFDGYIVSKEKIR